MEASIIPGIEVVPVENLKQLIQILNKEIEIPIQEKLDLNLS